MNRSYNVLLLAIAFITIGCSEDNNSSGMAPKYAANQPENHLETIQEIVKHSSHKLSGQSHSGIVMVEDMSCSTCDTGEIGRKADELPAPINRQESQLVSVDLYTEELIAEMMPEVTYKYWTYNGKIPGPFIRARAGDQVEVHLRHGRPDAEHKGHNEQASAEHAAGGHSAHSIDLHAVVGPGGGAPLMQVAQGEEKRFRFKATHPGIYMYHCASPHVPSHIANGMYGLILVEPQEGLAKVDREFYVMQGEYYTDGKFGDKGFQKFNKEKLLAEHPEYFFFQWQG